MTQSSAPLDGVWIALAIGNSRLHWATFAGNCLQQTWNTPHLSSEAFQELKANQFDFTTILSPSFPRTPFPTSPHPELWVASVVPAQSDFWNDYSDAQFLTLKQVPLRGVYPTLGIDRAVALWGAICMVGSPVLVIDAGTALTFTGAGNDHNLVGGAILPGLRLQFQALKQGTAALSQLSTPDSQLPTLHRWALNTKDAIASGVFHTLIAGMRSFIEEWWQQFPDSPVVLTGEIAIVCINSFANCLQILLLV